MIRPDLAALHAKWTGNDGLRLQDRLITFGYVENLCNASGAPLYGQLRIDNLDEGRFSVFIQDPSTWPPGSRELSPETIEEAFVHELVHIRWIDLTADKADATSLVQEERATWATARALVRATTSQRAAMVRAMVSRTAATRRQTTGKGKTVDAKQVLAAIKEQDEAAALQILEAWLAEQIGGSAAPQSGNDAPDGMGADAGNGPPDNKDKPPMNMRDQQTQYQRAMKAHLDEVKLGTDIVRRDAKAAIVRGMKADGLKLTPHAEKQILSAATIEEAQGLERMARSMSAEPVDGAQDPKKPARPPVDKGSTAGLTRQQAAKYTQMHSSGNPRAEVYRTECLRQNKAAEGGV